MPINAEAKAQAKVEARAERARRGRFHQNKTAPTMSIGSHQLTEPAQRKRWRERVLVAHGPLGSIAVAHLGSMHHNVHLAKTAHRWLFDAFDIVIGDFNAQFGSMLDVSIDAVTHASATHPSYLPAVDYKQAAVPPSFDQAVVKRPLSVRLAAQQMWKLQRIKLNPRKQMLSRSIPSDHVPVEVVVCGTQQTAPTLRLATWNCADPWYFGAFHKNGSTATTGFVPEYEEDRLELILEAIETLLDRNDVVGLQEVPRAVAQEATAAAKSRNWSISGIVTPAAADEIGDQAPIMMLLVDPAAGLRVETEAPSSRSDGGAERV